MFLSRLLRSIPSRRKSHRRLKGRLGSHASTGVDEIRGPGASSGGLAWAGPVRVLVAFHRASHQTEHGVLHQAGIIRVRVMMYLQSGRHSAGRTPEWCRFICVRPVSACVCGGVRSVLSPIYIHAKRWVHRRFYGNPCPVRFPVFPYQRPSSSRCTRVSVSLKGPLIVGTSPARSTAVLPAPCQRRSRTIHDGVEKMLWYFW